MNPPIFYAGRPLKAQDLINMETYLLSVNSMKDGTHGVISLYAGDKKPKISRGKTGLSCHFMVEEVSGITPSGRPVLIKVDPQMPPLSLPVTFNHDNDQQVADIFVDDMHFDASDKNGHGPHREHTDTTLQKYRLSMDPVNEETAPINFMKNDGNSLYLGRYVIWLNRTPEMIQPPLPYYLSAVRFPSDWWNDWTKDIREALKKIMDKQKDNPVIASFVLDMAYNFHRWPMSRLIHACSTLDALVASAGLDAQNALEEEFWLSKLQTKDFFGLFAGSMTANIPSMIIALLKEGAGTEIVSRNAYHVQNGRLLTFSLKTGDVKYLKIEIPESYTPQTTKQGIPFTSIHINGFERKFAEILTEPDVFKGQRRYFECEYYTNSAQCCTIHVDFDWTPQLKVFKSQHPFKQTAQ